MICFKCSVQMHQYKKIGGGNITPDGLNYMTWELKICPNCAIIVKETYGAKVISQEEFEEILQKQTKTKIPKTKKVKLM